MPAHVRQTQGSSACCWPTGSLGLPMRSFTGACLSGVLTGQARPAVREPGSADMPSPPRRDTRERELLSAYGQLGDANEVLNERAVAVMKRMSDKLTGRDFLQVSIQRSLPARQPSYSRGSWSGGSRGSG